MSPYLTALGVQQRRRPSALGGRARGLAHPLLYPDKVQPVRREGRGRSRYAEAARGEDRDPGSEGHRVRACVGESDGIGRVYNHDLGRGDEDVGLDRETGAHPNVDKQLLRKLYDEIAEVILQLWAVNFDRIGTVSWDMDTEEFDTLTPAFTTCINDMMVYGRVLADDLYTDSFKSALDFFSNTAGQYVTHLMRQRNAVYNSQDCREKYVCRTLFHSTVPYFTYDIDINGPFKLFCDGFHPRNIFVDPETLKITGIIDWEFTYAAPPQFLGSAPEWLLLKNPCDWADDHGLSSFLKTYLPKLDLFIESIEKLERQRTCPLETANPSLRACRASMDEQTFWFNIAIRNPFSLDSIYWTVLDNCASDRRRRRRGSRGQRAREVCTKAWRALWSLR
ncbi:hypothetical protein CISG_08227 [Coccidioides immitis RMSCC 3703]|uniref:Uncharacterized protein n=1 Tax=Coccidioides immitis RMSCC 3703 TaxID=454286 RepID=A0A0J8R676_COCIT|nr:hypothetical protein CISG_08227 [Coccidioides immitis RMSCC 3703]